MSVDLQFHTAGIDRYSVITLIFFIPYVICQPPATVIMRKIGPRIFLAAITIMWGGIMIVSSTVLPIGNRTTTNTHGRPLDSSRSGLRWSDSALFSVFLRLVSSPAAYT